MVDARSKCDDKYTGFGDLDNIKTDKAPLYTDTLREKMNGTINNQRSRNQTLCGDNY